MKSTLMAAFLLASVVSQAQPASFSAFSKGDELYVTVLGDTCNGIGAELNVADICRADRLTRNYAVACSAQLNIITTEMACGPGLEPKALTISLSKSNVAREAKELTLEYFGTKIEVQLEQ